MRLLDDVSRRALEGSRPADTLIAWVWRGGNLILPEPLEVIDWSGQDDAGDSVKVNQKMTFTIADNSGKLGAWRLDDVLGVAGTRLHVVYKIGGAGAVNFGRFRITDNAPDEVTETRVINEYGYIEPDGSLPPHKRRIYITRAVVRIDAVDLTVDADNDKFEAPVSPPSGATVRSEFQRLMARHFPTVFEPGVPDSPLSSQLIFQKERLEAGQDILSVVGARYRMGGDGECQAYMPGGAPVLRIEPDAGLVSVSRKQSITGLYNRWVVEGKEATDGSKVTAAVSLEQGPLRYDGPHGRIPFFYSSTMIESWEQAYAYALKLRNEFLASLAVELEVSTVPRPELQGGDRIEVGCPIAAGHVVYVPGTITSISRQGDKAPRETRIRVACAYGDVDHALTTSPWAEYLTDQKPELTWERMPSTWGRLPNITWDALP
ncbi:hypothetical protein [Arthrobacter sp. C152]